MSSGPEVSTRFLRKHGLARLSGAGRAVRGLVRGLRWALCGASGGPRVGPPARRAGPGRPTRGRTVLWKTRPTDREVAPLFPRPAVWPPGHALPGLLCLQGGGGLCPGLPQGRVWRGPLCPGGPDRARRGGRGADPPPLSCAGPRVALLTVPHSPFKEREVKTQRRPASRRRAPGCAAPDVAGRALCGSAPPVLRPCGCPRPCVELSSPPVACVWAASRGGRAGGGRSRSAETWALLAPPLLNPPLCFAVRITRKVSAETWVWQVGRCRGPCSRACARGC